MFKLLISSLLFLFSSAVIVSTSYGKLKGKVLNLNGEDIYLFMGIPQQAPPLGKLRFSVPEPPKHWNGILEATKYRAPCLSDTTATSSPQFGIDEDCLYINIFTSKKCLENNCPVIFYIHGGGMYYDSAVMFNETFLAERYVAQDVVFVIPSYRLGLFGQLLIGDLIPPNLAIFDIVSALEWNHNEIRNFGGDPHRVTLLGHSSGASVAIYLSASQLIDPDRRLFQQSIALSGDAFFEKYETRKNVSEEFAKRAKCNHNDPHTVLECLRRRDARLLLSIQREIDDEGFPPVGNLYGPPFVESSCVPVKDFIRNIPKRNFLFVSTAVEFFKGSTMNDVEYGQFIGLTHADAIRAKFDADWTDENGDQIPPNYMSHTVFMSIASYGSALERKGATVYVQEYSQPPMPLHASDMKYFIGSHRNNMTDDELIIDKFYSQRLINFVKHGKPSRDAKKFNYPISNYYNIIVDKEHDHWPSYEVNYHKNIVEYWKEMAVFDKMLTWIDKISSGHNSRR